MHTTVKLLVGAIAGFVGASGVRHMTADCHHAPTQALWVRADDLDFNHPPDAAVLVERVMGASVAACGGTPNYRHPRQVELFNQCRTRTINHVVQELHQPMVTEVARTYAWLGNDKPAHGQAVLIEPPPY